MATNKLMEAASDILSQSRTSAPAEPMHKVDAQVVDLGGPTYKNSNPLDDSNKLDASGKAVDYASKNRASIKAKASNASADTQIRLGGGKKEMGEEMDEDGDLIEEEDIREQVKQDIADMFADDSTISEDFKQKASTIFEARVLDRVSYIQEEIESQYASMLEEAVDEIRSDLTQKVDDYLSYVVEQWIDDNEIAIESGLRTELSEEFIAGLRNLFAEHYIDVPEEKVDLVEELASKVEELESRLNEEVERSIEYKKHLTEAVRQEIAHEVTEGLVATQSEKLKGLAESVEFTTADEFKEKLEVLRENYFPSGMKKGNGELLHEIVDDVESKKSISNDPFVNAVSQAITKIKF